VILVVAEQRKGALHRASWEALAAAQALAVGQSAASPGNIEALVGIASADFFLSGLL